MPRRMTCWILLSLLALESTEPVPAQQPPAAIAPQRAAEGTVRDGEQNRLPETITNTIGMQLKLIPAGEFLMGRGESAAAIARRFDVRAEQYQDEQPRHRVQISKPFYMGQHEVTRGQFRRFVEATAYETEPERDGQGGYGWNALQQRLQGRDPRYSWRNTGFEQTDRHPVVNVTWNDAAAFCKWLSHKEEAEYRLPTEAEWEYACRAGTTTHFSQGDNAGGLAAVGNVADETARRKLARYQSWSYTSDRDGYAFTAPVGSFRPNAYGLHDMHGNAWEWCADWYDADYYGNSPATDPRGPSKGTKRIGRGGSWISRAADCRSANRLKDAPDARIDGGGFRVVRVPSSEPGQAGDQ